jgi:hypothetical protein
VNTLELARGLPSKISLLPTASPQAYLIIGGFMVRKCDWDGCGIYGNAFEREGDLYWHTTCYSTYLFYKEHNALAEYERRKREYFDKFDKRLEGI